MERKWWVFLWASMREGVAVEQEVTFNHADICWIIVEHWILASTLNSISEIVGAKKFRFKFRSILSSLLWLYPIQCWSWHRPQKHVSMLRPECWFVVFYLRVSMLRWRRESAVVVIEGSTLNSSNTSPMVWYAWNGYKLYPSFWIYCYYHNLKRCQSNYQRESSLFHIFFCLFMLSQETPRKEEKEGGRNVRRDDANTFHWQTLPPHPPTTPLPHFSINATRIIWKWEKGVWELGII